MVLEAAVHEVAVDLVDDDEVVAFADDLEEAQELFLGVGRAGRARRRAEDERLGLRSDA
jgi:hypothetical protein